MPVILRRVAPPPGVISCSPSNAIVSLAVFAGNLKIGGRQVWKRNLYIPRLHLPVIPPVAAPLQPSFLHCWHFSPDFSGYRVLNSYFPQCAEPMPSPVFHLTENERKDAFTHFYNLPVSWIFDSIFADRIKDCLICPLLSQPVERGFQFLRFRLHFRLLCCWLEVSVVPPSPCRLIISCNSGLPLP